MKCTPSFMCAWSFLEVWKSVRLTCLRRVNCWSYGIIRHACMHDSKLMVLYTNHKVCNKNPCQRWKRISPCFKAIL